MLKMIKYWWKKSKMCSILCLWMGRLNSLKLSILPRLIYRFNVIPVIMPARYVYRYKLILKFILKGTGLGIPETILKKKYKMGGITTWFQDCVVTVSKAEWYWWKVRHVSQWNIIENTEADTHQYAQLMFDKRTEAIQQRKDSLFNKWFWSSWTSVGKKMNLDLNLYIRCLQKLICM